MKHIIIYILFVVLFSGCVSSEREVFAVDNSDSILSRINEERSAKNLTGLIENESLDVIADRRVHDLMNYSLTHDMRLTHDIPRTGYPDEAFELYDIRWTSYGEINGYSTNNSSIIDGWKKSTNHYASIINPDYRKIGVGVSKNENATWYLVLFTS
jgi:uncharacterized protein YkwD